MSMRHLLLPTMVALIGTATVCGPASAAAPDQVQGKGTWHIEAGGQFADFTVDVNATDSTPRVGTDAKGQLTITEVQSIGTSTTTQAEPFCANAQGNQGAVVATVTAGPATVIGQTVFVWVIDNGKGKDAPPDEILFGFTRMTPEEALAAGFCQPSPALEPVASGDFTVRDRVSA